MNGNSGSNIIKYCSHFFLEMSHSFDGDRKKEHNHTLEILCFVELDTSGGFDVMDYNKVERQLLDCLAPYQESYLNDMEVFAGDTTIENVGEVICREINDRAMQMGINLYRFEIAETPLRSYVITDKL